MQRRKYYICFAKLYGKDLDCLIDKGGQIVTYYGIIFKQLLNRPSDRCAYAIYIVGATPRPQIFPSTSSLTFPSDCGSLNIVAL